MPRTFRRSVVIVLGGAALGLAVNAVSPRGIPYITPPKPTVAVSDAVPLQRAHELWESGAAFFLDARAPADYEAGHVANAISLPVEQFDEHFPRAAAILSPESSIVVYCDGEECELSHHLLELLRQRGYTNAHMLVNGWTVWHNAGYPTTAGAQP